MSDPLREQRVSVLVGDRLCTRCAYNLTGQPVLREPHYKLLIVRCPECGEAASVQEYPLLGRWAHRWAFVLAAFWLLILLAMWIGTGAAIFGLSVGTAEIATEKYANFIHAKYESEKDPQSQTIGWYSADVAAWWKKQDAEAIFDQAGGWRGAVDWRALWMWIIVALACTALATFWSVVLMGSSRRRLALWSIAIMVVACAFSAIMYVQWLTPQDYWWHWPIAESAVCPLVCGLTLGFAWFALLLGMMVGRPIARWFICMLLPPRSRGALAALWTIDGLKPPLR